jgi:hypothetical protein
LESSEYRASEQYIRSEISRVEGTTTEFNDNQRKLQAELRKHIESKYLQRRENINRQKRNLEFEEEEIRREENEFESSFRRRVEKKVGISETDEHKSYRNLERTYLRKADEENKIIGALEQEQSDIDGKIKSTSDSTRIAQNRVESITRSIRGIPAITDKFRGIIARTTEDIEREKQIIESLRRDIEHSEERFIELKRRDEDEICRTHLETQTRIREEERRIIESIEKRSFEGYDEFTRQCKKLFDDITKFSDWSSIESAKKRIETARGCIKSGSYKNWHI